MSQSVSSKVTLSSRLIAATRGGSFSRSLVGDKAVLVLIGAAFLAVTAQISIPFPGSPVPITGQTLGALLIGGSLGYQVGVFSFITYLLAGTAGLPVFAGHSHGWSHISGATGGYLVGMLIATFILGFAVNKGFDKKVVSWFASIATAEAAIFILGVSWLKFSTHQSLAWSISKGFTPFILGEIIKIGIATTTMPSIWKLVNKK